MSWFKSQCNVWSAEITGGTSPAHLPWPFLQQCLVGIFSNINKLDMLHLTFGKWKLVTLTCEFPFSDWNTNNGWWRWKKHPVPTFAWCVPVSNAPKEDDSASSSKVKCQMWLQMHCFQSNIADWTFLQQDNICCVHEQSVLVYLGL